MREYVKWLLVGIHAESLSCQLETRQLRLQTTLPTESHTQPGQDKMHWLFGLAFVVIDYGCMSSYRLYSDFTPKGGSKNLFNSSSGTWGKCSLMIAQNFNLSSMQNEK